MIFFLKCLAVVTVYVGVCVLIARACGMNRVGDRIAEEHIKEIRKR